MKLLSLIVYLIGLLVTISSAQTVDDLILMSEEFPPYNFTENGRLKGTSIDLVVLMLKKMNSKLTRDDIVILPWARSYDRLQNRKNTVLFAVTRTEIRDNLFKWVGPISRSRNVLIARKDLEIKPESLSDLKRYRICAVRDDAGEQILTEKSGIKRDDIIKTHKAGLCLLMLSKNRVDLMSYDESVANWIIKNSNLDPFLFRTVYVLEEGEHYIAFHRDTPDSIINKFQNTLDAIKKSGEYKKILDQYLK